MLARLREIFGLRYREKYFAPGMVRRFDKSWVFEHDATTLGGNSGSLIGMLEGGLSAAGLHFAGDWLRANYGHDLALARASDKRLDDALKGAGDG